MLFSLWYGVSGKESFTIPSITKVSLKDKWLVETALPLDPSEVMLKQHWSLRSTQWKGRSSLFIICTYNWLKG